MNKLTYELLDEISEGIVVLNAEYQICSWNKYMIFITGIGKEDVQEKNIYTVLPTLNKNYFNVILQNALDKGHNMFFSAAMHKDLLNLNNNFYLNLKVSKFTDHESKFLLLEFIDVTSLFIQVKQLKAYVNELHQANKKLLENEKTITTLAYYDQLTEVANRRLFFELSDKYLNSAKRSNALLCLMFIDINKFKTINDTYGHEVGDKVIVTVANLLKEVTRDEDVVARYGGDEFLILLPHMKNQNFNSIISRIFKHESKNFIYKDINIRISFSIGISFYPYDGNTIDELIKAADNAMYIAKKNGGEDSFYCQSYNN